GVAHGDAPTVRGEGIPRKNVPTTPRGGHYAAERVRGECEASNRVVRGIDQQDAVSELTDRSVLNGYAIVRNRCVGAAWSIPHTRVAASRRIDAIALYSVAVQVDRDVV